MPEFSMTLTRVLVSAATAPIAGRLAFAGVFAALILWLLFVPASRLGEEDMNRRVWQTSRFWAVLVAASQVAVYLIWH